MVNRSHTTIANRRGFSSFEIHLTTAVQHIAVAGNIGAGKTTLVNRLSDHFGWRPLFESVDDNPYLEDFYEDMHQWAFPLQVYFLNSRFNQAMDIRSSDLTIIQDRTIFEDAHIFARNLYEGKYLSQRDYDNYLGLFKSMSSLVQPPDLLIYLKASVPTLMDHISERGRDYEETISIGYLESLNRMYEDWIRSYTHGKLLIIPVDQIDFVKRPDDWGYVLERVNRELFGLF